MINTWSLVLTPGFQVVVAAVFCRCHPLNILTSPFYLYFVYGVHTQRISELINICLTETKIKNVFPSCIGREFDGNNLLASLPVDTREKYKIYEEKQLTLKLVLVGRAAGVCIPLQRKPSTKCFGVQTVWGYFKMQPKKRQAYDLSRGKNFQVNVLTTRA